MTQPFTFQSFTENYEILSFERTVVFIDFLIIRIGSILSDLMRDYRNVRYPFCGSVSSLHRLGFRTILDLDLSASGSFHPLSVEEILRDDLIVIVFHRAWQIDLDMT
ncbi:hypothetical protein D3C76_1035350 [compost metagenome]